jgi:hypothetical protein
LTKSRGESLFVPNASLFQNLLVNFFAFNAAMRQGKNAVSYGAIPPFMIAALMVKNAAMLFQQALHLLFGFEHGR